MDLFRLASSAPSPFAGKAALLGQLGDRGMMRTKAVSRQGEGGPRSGGRGLGDVAGLTSSSEMARAQAISRQGEGLRPWSKYF